MHWLRFSIVYSFISSGLHQADFPYTGAVLAVFDGDPINHTVCDDGICVSQRSGANKRRPRKGKSNDSFIQFLLRTARGLITAAVRAGRPFIIPLVATGLRLLIEALSARRNSIP